MPLFGQKYNRPGPGIPRDEPRKKGVARFFEVISRDIGNLIKLNLFYQLCILPSQVLLLLACYFFGSILSLVFGVLALAACIPLGPARTALFFCVSKMLRDEPGFVGHDFLRIFKSNFRLMAIPGLIYGLGTGVQVMFAIYIFAQQENVPFGVLSLVFLVIVFALITPYLFLQAGYMELKAPALTKNSLFLAIAYFPRSFAGAILSGAATLVHTVANLLFSFLFLPVTVFFGHVFPCLISLMFIWPPVDKTFSIEKTLLERNEPESC